jgi:hypothetical protein
LEDYSHGFDVDGRPKLNSTDLLGYKILATNTGFFDLA